METQIVLCETAHYSINPCFHETMRITRPITLIGGTVALQFSVVTGRENQGIICIIKQVKALIKQWNEGPHVAAHF